MFNKLEGILMPLADKLGKNRVLIAIRDGFLISTPLLIVGSIFLLIANFPLPGWSETIASFAGEGWEAWFTNVSRATFNLTGLLTCLGTGYAYARELKGDKIQGAVVSLVAFVILTNTRISSIPGVILEEGSIAAENGIDGLAFQFIGADGIFMGLVCSLISVLIFTWVYKKGWTIKMPKGVPPAVADSFAALVPSAFVMTVFFLLRILFGLTSFGTAHQFVLEILQTPLKGMGDTLAANMIYSFACTFLWFFGINGPAVANSVYFIGNVLTIEQLAAFEAGKALPYIFTNPFSNFFCNFGGGGSTLSLVIVMLGFCKSQRIRQLEN